MNPISPKKLHNSKWTSVHPQNKEKHFIITAVEFDENGVVIHCEIEAVMTKRTTEINWQDLKDPDHWRAGWQ